MIFQNLHAVVVFFFKSTLGHCGLYSPVVAGVAGGGMPGGTVGAIVAQPKDMEINIDRHKDRKTKAILLFVNIFIALTTCQNQLQFMNGFSELKKYIYVVLLQWRT